MRSVKYKLVILSYVYTNRHKKTERPPEFVDGTCNAWNSSPVKRAGGESQVQRKSQKSSGVMLITKLF